MAIDDLMKASRKELDEVKEKYSAENLVNEKQKIRAINAAASTCSRLANRLSAAAEMANAGSRDAATDLAKEILEFGEDLEPTFKLVETLRSKPNELMGKAVPPSFADAFRRFPVSLQVQQLSNAAAHGANRVGAGVPALAAAKSLMAFIRGCPDDECSFTISASALVDCSVRARFQTNQVGMIAERLSKACTKLDFISCWKGFLDAGLVPGARDLQGLVRLAEDEREKKELPFSLYFAKGEWCAQAGIDLAAVGVLASVVENENDANPADARLFLQDVAQLHAAKTAVSIRIRTSRSLQKASGDGDVLRYAWSLVAKHMKKVGEQGEVEGAFITLLKEVSEYIPVDGAEWDLETTLSLLCAAFDNDMDAKILECAKKLQELRALPGTLSTEAVNGNAAFRRAAAKFACSR